MLTLLFALIFSYSANVTGTESAIEFHKVGIDEAIAIAQRENKLIFIDTYAVWCKPCKQMDSVFETNDVATYFNNNFINVKVDMDGYHGKEVSEAYDVVWLPTLIILDQNGEIRNKIDRVVGADELLQIAKDAINPNYAFEETTFDSNPFGKSSPNATPQEKVLVTEENAPVVYVYDDRASSGRPHIMYHEAYLHLQLMDGKQHDVAKKYLSTQTDWSTPKNVKFIFDFLRSAKSPEFDFFIANRHLFEDTFGVEKVNRNIEILVYQRLYKGYPRPGLVESIKLFSYVDPQKADELAYVYYLDRLSVEGKNLELTDIAKEYLTNVNPYNHKVMTMLSSALMNNGSGRAIDESLRWAQEASIYDGENAEIQLLLAKIYYKKGDKARSKVHCDEALTLAQLNNIDAQEIIAFKSTLQNM